ncbi:MAG: entericidin, EcnA/B family [Alphaproteobacteria bacterium PRO2]|nr:entericidin, EcnA/B family [Alphaproteobacteria bacterium PRO2]
MLVLGALLCTFAVTACENTWHGMGRDTERVGEKMQNQYN